MYKHLLYIILIALTVMGCKSNAELSMERGEYYYNTNQLELAIQEYKKVLRNSPSDISNLDEHNVKMIANAYHNIAISYWKRGHKLEGVAQEHYYDLAVHAAKKAYNIYPKDIYKEHWDSIAKAQK